MFQTFFIILSLSCQGLWSKTCYLVLSMCCIKVSTLLKMAPIIRQLVNFDRALILTGFTTRPPSSTIGVLFSKTFEVVRKLTVYLVSGILFLKLWQTQSHCLKKNSHGEIFKLLLLLELLNWSKTFLQ